MDNRIDKSAYDEDYAALKDFLLDIDCLDSLDEWISNFNLFDILKISRTEIRHSNVLAWLLDPNGNHGFGDRIIKGIIQFIVSWYSSDDDIFKTLLMDCHDFIIQREWHHIDILAVSHSQKYVICIENKIDSGEHNNQLKRYHDDVEQVYSDYRIMYIFLSPDGRESSEPETWLSMGYQDILDILDSSSKKVHLIPETQLLINNYIDTIRRDIVGDEKLSQICAEIYAKHQRALDLLFEYRPDRAAELAEIFHNWCIKKTEEGAIEFVPEKSGKTYTRFKTKTMSQILPDAQEAASGWNTKNYYFYEIRNNDGKEYFIQLAFSSKNIPDELKATCEKINSFYPSRQQKKNWQWRIHFSTKRSKPDEALTENKIYEQLDKKLEEILKFESDLLEKLTENIT